MAWKRTGNSANIVFYGERPRAKGYLWAEVLGSHIELVGGKHRKRDVPIFRGTIYKHGVGEVGKFETEARVDELSARTVARLVKKALA